MTIFGVDVSEHQNGMSLRQAAREGMAFAIIRTTDGTYRDRTYRSHMADAESAGLITAAYHYLRSPREGTTVAQQVAASVEVMGDMKRPVWIDVETEAGLHVDDIRACKREFECLGVRVIGAYSYVPYWEGRIRPFEPDSHEFGAFWVAAYGANRVGKPQALYPGDHDRQWAYPLGNQKPSIWQFGSRAQVAGREVDINAYRGTKEQLRMLFYGTTTKPKEAKKVSEKVLEYLRDQVHQDTAYNCGPASVQTIVRSATGKLIGEHDLGKQLGTTVNGTNWIGSFPAVLNKHIPGAKYTSVEMPNDPPTGTQKSTLWEHIVRSIDAGHGVVANIVAPPNNYPVAVAPSTISPAYSGGTVYHYIALMGYAGSGDSRRVWVADSGFMPFGYWIGFDQLASLIPPKGYAYSTAVAKAPVPVATTPKKGDTGMSDSLAKQILEALTRIDSRLTNVETQLMGPTTAQRKAFGMPVNPAGGRGWPQLGQNAKKQDLTLIDAVANLRLDVADIKEALND